MVKKGDTSKALKKRLEKAGLLENKILEKIQEHPYGLSDYDLASLLQATPIGIKKALERIKNFQDKVITKQLKRKKNIVKFYFPKLDGEEIVHNHFEIDISKMKSSWRDSALIYTDTRENVVVISPKPNRKFENQFFKDQLPIHKQKKKIIFIIPEKISYGLDLKNKEPDYVVEKDHIKIKFTEKEFFLPELKNRKVLILDDKDEIRIKQLIAVLEKKYAIDYFKDQKKAITKLTTKKYDFLILDWIIDDEILEYKKIMSAFHKKNPQGKAVIMTAKSFTRDEIIKFTPKGITWFFDKTLDRLAHRIDDEMRAVLT